ncbi:MAG: DUF502 domain-containing protein [Gammaproteobacteria bacterium]|nr:DUF502 domain-containing protein [Gammaproteobacteria bacterium]
MYLKRYLLSGVITVIPLWVTWVVFNFVFNQLSKFGTPWVRALSRNIQEDSPALARWLLAPWLQDVLAAFLTLIALYLLGWAVTRVVGRRAFTLMEDTLGRLPLVTRVYGAAKKLVTVLQQEPEGVRRVVLIPFPTPEMKTVGFVTRTLKDATTGEELAAVYVPTTPNPTSGYLEIVPVRVLVATDWSAETAMNFIISGGAVAPPHIHYHQPHMQASHEDGSSHHGTTPDKGAP